MGTRDIINVFPTAMEKRLMEGRKKVADRGFDILKRKSEILQMKFRSVGKDIVEIKTVMGEIMKEASVLLAETKYSSGISSSNILNCVDRARIRVKDRTDNLAGVKLKVFECFKDGKDIYSLAGLSRGGDKVILVKKAYVQAAEMLVELATLQTTFITLDEIIKVTNRRVNALEYNYIPKLERTIKYIEDEMDENERQEFFRLKKVQDMKKVLTKRKEAEYARRFMERETE
ncbi:V-type proton ATPase subunit D-like [Uloborus diversus]|uniref:V-type proton ATPase subunit D-like n=1 Tax=Uloborus diversus TaxID=327109 RepID=UPI002409D383|nr:V-type proton ATPase subunit D-like [Uloborus diversus]